MVCKRNFAPHFLRAVFFLVIAGAAWFLNQTGFFSRSMTWIQGLGGWGPAVFVGLCVLASVFFAPSSVLAFGGGALFGIGRGILFSLLGCGLGAVSALFIGRYFARDWIARKFSHHAQFQMIERLIDRKGWKIVALARLSPVFPFLIGNYVFGLTRLPALSYLLASILGSIPSTSVYVYLGALSRDLVSINDPARARSPLEWGLLLAGLLATVLFSFYLKRAAQHAMELK